MKKQILGYALMIAFSLSITAAFGADPAPTQSTQPTSERKTSIKFEDEVVEGMNKNPLDSVEQISQQDSEGQHLYRKRKSFKDQTPTLIREMGFGL